MAGVSYGPRANTNTNYPKPQGVLMTSGMPKALCSSLAELVNALDEDISAGAKSLVPECTTSELSLDLCAVLPLQRPNIGPYANGGTHDLPPQFKTNQHPGDAHPQASVADIVSIADSQVRAIVQRAASRGIIAAIEALDGFKYSFNNAWGAKDEDGQRFSYICQDSMQNKDRHANGFTRTQKHLKGDGERGVRKPTFDCKGSISVKCSLSRRCVDVYYRHYAIHCTVADRRRGPGLSRPARADVLGSAVQVENENEVSGGLVGQLQAENLAHAQPAGTQAPPVPSRQEPSNIGRPLKRKREFDSPVQSTNTSEPLSLVDLLNQSPAARSPPTPFAVAPRMPANGHIPHVAYDLPSWAPNPKPLPAPAPHNNQMQSGPSKRPGPPVQPRNHFGAPYPASYHPNQPQHSHPPPIPQTLPPNTEARPVPPPQQAFGAPKQVHPQSQGLFTTMKPVPQDHTPIQPTQPYGHPPAAAWQRWPGAPTANMAPTQR